MLGIIQLATPMRSALVIPNDFKTQSSNYLISLQCSELLGTDINFLCKDVTVLSQWPAKAIHY